MSSAHLAETEPTKPRRETIEPPGVVSGDPISTAEDAGGRSFASGGTFCGEEEEDSLAGGADIGNSARRSRVPLLPWPLAPGPWRSRVPLLRAGGGARQLPGAWGEEEVGNEN